jgi:hypothetical protein
MGLIFIFFEIKEKLKDTRKTSLRSCKIKQMKVISSIHLLKSTTDK